MAKTTSTPAQKRKIKKINNEKTITQMRGFWVEFERKQKEKQEQQTYRQTYTENVSTSSEPSRLNYDGFPNEKGNTSPESSNVSLDINFSNPKNIFSNPKNINPKKSNYSCVKVKPPDNCSRGLKSTGTDDSL